MDDDGNVYVSGTITDTQGTQMMVLIAYDASGNELWVKTRLPNDSEGSTKGKDVKVTNDQKVVIVGEETKDGNTDILAIQYDTDGDKKWEKNTDGGGNDKAAKVQLDASGDIYVTGKTSDGSTENYTTVKYSTFDKPTSVVMDSSGTMPLYLDNTFIVKFDPEAMITDNINALEKTWGKPEFFLKEDRLQQLEDSLGFALKDVTFIRMFKHLRTTDTISISRLGEEIPIPRFWSAFMLVTPEQWNTPETIDAFNTCYPVVHYAEYNRILLVYEGCEHDAEWTTVPAEDPTYSNQKSLGPLAYLENPDQRNDINVEPAWCFSTGEPHIRVGIMDSGLEYDHEEFRYTYMDPDGNFTEGNVVEGTFSYEGNGAFLQPGSADPGSRAHGTKVAGIIGAQRNNGTGIAGIAGGDVENGQYGVTLQGHQIWDGTLDEGENWWFDGNADLEYVANALITASTELVPPNDIEGYPMEPVHVMNHSWGIRPGTFGSQGSNINRLLFRAFWYSWRNKVINVAARGHVKNGDFPDDTPSYPASYQDAWVINVGATGKDGSYRHINNPVQGLSQWWSMVGQGIDLAAPGVHDLVKSVGNNSNYQTFNGTSAAAPHVSGTAAVMLSHWNQPVSNLNNLAPEDVEFLMEHTATDVIIPDDGDDNWDNFTEETNIEGPDQYIGHGRLNAGFAMSYLDHDRYQLHHYQMPRDELYLIDNVSDVTLDRLSGYTNYEGVHLPYSTHYTADVYQALASPIHGNLQPVMVGNDPDLMEEGLWPRYSSCNLMPPLNSDNELDPHEWIDQLQTGIWTGYVYHMFLNGQDMGWIPFNPNTFSQPLQFAYSLLEELPVGVEETETTETVSLYPNPGNGLVRVVSSTSQNSLLTVRVSDMQGRTVQSRLQLYSGQKMDLSHLSNGMYIVHIVTDQQEYRLQYIKN